MKRTFEQKFIDTSVFQHNTGICSFSKFFRFELKPSGLTQELNYNIKKYCVSGKGNPLFMAYSGGFPFKFCFRYIPYMIAHFHERLALEFWNLRTWRGLHADSKYPSKFAVWATLDYEILRPFQLMYHEPLFICMPMLRVYACSKGKGYYISTFLFSNRYYWETNWIIEAEQMRCLTKLLQKVWQFKLMTYLLRKT